MKNRINPYIASLLLMLLLSPSVFCGGCSRSAPQNEGGTRGAEVEIGGGEGIRVDAPGVDVKVGGGDGVKVDAPGAHVDLGGDQ